MVGNFLVESKEMIRKSYAIPDEIKKQYETQAKYTIMKIQKLGEND